MKKKFHYGCMSEQGKDYDFDENVHRVKLDAYCIGKYEVTQEFLEAIVGTINV